MEGPGEHGRAREGTRMEGMEGRWMDGMDGEF